jgi:ornithine decarboxylase
LKINDKIETITKTHIEYIMTDVQQYDISDIMSFLREVKVKSFNSTTDIYDIIRSFLDEYNNDQAFYIVDLTKIIEQHAKWVEHLPTITPYYAIKCNPNSAIIKLLDKLGVNFDCASKNEIAQVLAAGISPDRIIYANPIKESAYIKYARSTDVDLLVLDTPEEIYKIKLYHPEANLLIRIKIDDSKSICRFSCKFGASLKKVDEICNLAKASKLNVTGISFHVGSNCRDVETYRSAIKQSKEAFEIGKKYGFNFSILDIGGGFPGYNDDQISFESIAHTINSSLNELFPDEYIARDRFKVIAEPGRYFVSASHTLILNVIGKKDVDGLDVDEEQQLTKIIESHRQTPSDEKINASLRKRKHEDDTSNRSEHEYDSKKMKHYEPDKNISTYNEQEKRFVYYLNDGVYKSFNCIHYDHQQPTLCPYNERDGKLYKSTVFGPTCDSMDTITLQCELPDLAIGEWVFVENFGAYTTAAASTFNGFHEIPCFYIMKHT